MAKLPDYSKMTEGKALWNIGIRPGEKDGLKGLVVPSPDKPGQTLFIPASDEKPDYIVASEHKECRLKGSRKSKCVDCRRHVWISPSTQQMLRRYSDVPIICTSCFIKRLEKENIDKKEK